LASFPRLDACPLRLFVFVVAAPPLVRLGLRIAGRRVRPLFLAPERREVEEGPHAAEGLDAAGRREVGAKDVVAVAQEDAEAERLAVLVDALLGRRRPDAEVDIEIAFEGRVPGKRPAHSLPVGLERADRGAR